MSNALALCKPYIRESHRQDCMALAHTLREEDRAEIWYSSQKYPEIALKQGFDSGPTWIIQRGFHIVAMFGITGTKGRIGSPWMLGTNELPKCKSLLRECRKRLDGFLEEYHYLTNAVWAKNAVHIEWIKWLGFTFEGSDIRSGETFLHFHKRLHV